MIHSFLLIGQSNMAGRGYIEDAVEIDTSRIWVLRNGRWQRHYRPVNGDRPFSGVCLAESFAAEYAKTYDVDVGLIPCADGGTRLEQWQVGSILYDHAVAQARLAQRTSTIAGILWHQGEGDCAVNLYSTYAKRFKPMLDGLRNDLSLHDIPFLIGGLGDFLPKCPHDANLVNYHLLNNVFEQISTENTCVGYVSAEGLTANPDQLHFNAASLHEFGLRYFEVYQKYRNSDKIFESEHNDDIANRTAMESL